MITCAVLVEYSYKVERRAVAVRHLLNWVGSNDHTTKVVWREVGGENKNNLFSIHKFVRIDY